jgi:type IV pilus assembly protein PilO
MTSRLSKKNKIILFSGLLLLLAFIALGYLTFIQPLQTTIHQKEMELVSQQQLLEVIESRDIESSGELLESSVKLQRHIPVEPMLEQFILDLEMAETVSNSHILSISFADEGEGGEVPPTEQPAQNTDTTQTPETSQMLSKPEGIKAITIGLSIESDSYYDLEKFIDTLEKLDRIVEVKSLSFSGPPEVSSLGENTNQTKTSFQLSIAIYYFPKLQDLVEDLPEIQTESPGNKSNPLSNFSDVPIDPDANN